MTHAGQGLLDRRAMVESSDKTWSTGEGNGKPLQHSFLPWETHEQYEKAKKNMTLKDDPLRSVDV